MKSIEQSDNLVKFLLAESGRFKSGVALALFRTFAVAPLPWLFGAVIDTHVPAGNIEGIVVSLIIGMSLLLIYFGSAMIGARLVGRAITELTRDLRSSVFRRMQFLSFGYLDQNAAGRLLSKYAFDTQKIQDITLNVLNAVLPAVFLGLVMIVFMRFVNWQLTLAVLLVMPIVFGIQWIFKKRMKDGNRDLRLAQESLTGNASELIGALRLVRSLGEERKAEDRLSEHNSRLAQARYGLFSLGSAFGAVVQTTNHFVSLVMVGFGGWMVINGSMSVGMLFTFVAALPTIMAPFGLIATMFEQYMSGQEAVRSIRELLTCKYVEQWNGKTRLEKMRGDIRFIDVEFAYPSKKENVVLRDFNLHIRSGESVALVGASGSGKSTLANLVLGLYPLTRGAIEVDGVPLEHLDMRRIRKDCAIVMQDNILLSGSVYDNIRFAREHATREEVVAAAQAANADAFIRDLPDGYETMIGERGVSLSGGQRQRISIARAILRDPQLLILDEATSALDNESEALIQDALDRLTRGRTVITIAHRLSTIRNADRIIVLGDGSILEQGSFADLAKKNGHFARLLDSQIKTSSALATAGHPAA